MQEVTDVLHKNKINFYDAAVILNCLVGTYLRDYGMSYERYVLMIQHLTQGNKIFWEEKE